MRQGVVSNPYVQLGGAAPANSDHIRPYRGRLNTRNDKLSRDCGSGLLDERCQQGIGRSEGKEVRPREDASIRELFEGEILETLQEGVRVGYR
jgi:hypothetical protein